MIKRIAIVVVALAALPLLLGGCGEAEQAKTGSTVASTISTSPPQTSAPIAGSGLPQVIDLGSNSCIPCQMMAPELEALAREYAGSVDVVIVDVNNTEEGAALAQQLKVRVIPTQIFVDATGAEFFRHEGFMSEEDMLAVFEQRGYALQRVGPVRSDSTQGDR